MGLLDFLKRDERPSGLSAERAADYEAAERLLREYLKHSPMNAFYQQTKPESVKAGRDILGSAPGVHAAVVHQTLATARRGDWTMAYRLRPLFTALLRRHLPFEEAELRDMLCLLSDAGLNFTVLPTYAILKQVERFVEAQGLSLALNANLVRLRESLVGTDAESFKICTAINKMLGAAASFQLADSGEPWASVALADLAGMTQDERAKWEALLAHALASEAAKPSSKWLAEAKRLTEAIEHETFRDRALAWLGRVNLVLPVTMTMHQQSYKDYEESQRVGRLVSHNSGVLKGLVWCARLFEDDETFVRALGTLGETAFKKSPGYGARSAKVGNACVATLAALPGMLPVAQLSRLKLKVKYPAVLALIDKTLEEAAKRAGLPKEDLEELSVPTFGLDSNGERREELGDCTAVLALGETGTVDLRWLGKDGQALKSLPAEVKREHLDTLKGLKQAKDDLGKMLPAQRDRLERLLLTDRAWPVSVWRERYAEHPLLANLTRRLIWHVKDGERSALGMWREGRIVDVADAPLDWLSGETQVRLWHPIGFAPDEVLAWRRFLEERQIVQPFKQAHREIYVLTDAELNTQTYSNRFAAHILKQHQFSALCRERGWQYALHGGFDGGDVPTLTLPRHGLRVEFWVEGALDDRVTDSGISMYIATDQVRFYAIDSPQPLPLTEVSALVFTETMRDVDLFVGVCSVGNDPQWQDGGTQGDATRDYWRGFSFGDLNASAQTRRDVLTRLLPRLKIAPRCALEGKFLKVRGELRTYKIHLGSGNILMEPNDHYLCIVPGRSSEDKGEAVLLPFEGDRTLSVILSKAFLLADDKAIKDTTITRQIKG